MQDFKHQSYGLYCRGLNSSTNGLGRVYYIQVIINEVVSSKRGPQYGPENTAVLTMGTPKIIPLILGNPKP